MEIILKKSTDLSENDLLTNPVWVTYYEPEEFELLEELGFDVDAFKKALNKISYSDEYIFPLPAKAATMPFKYISLSAKIKTPSGKQLIGYRTRVSLTLFYDCKKYYFNKNLLDLSIKQASELALVVGEKNLFPLTVEILALNKVEIFVLNNG